MQYVKFGRHGLDVSRLGFGTMRLPTVKDGEKTVIDRPRAIGMIRRGIDGGITYVDTAYMYHDGESETVTGLALRDGYRERVQLTTKLPPWYCQEEKDMNRLLDEQLGKLGVAYLDNYLLHALNRDTFQKLQSFHYKDFLRQAIRDGRIRRAGFSFHDNYDAFMTILNDWDEWDLCQIQFNYLDDREQATVDGLREAGKRGIAVVIMEPLRGGALANPPGNVKERIAAYEKQRSAVEWAFAYVADHPEVSTILSGMSTPEQLEDNLRIFDALTAKSAPSAGSSSRRISAACPSGAPAAPTASPAPRTCISPISSGPTTRARCSTAPAGSSGNTGNWSRRASTLPNACSAAAAKACAPSIFPSSFGCRRLTGNTGIW